jgi:ATP-binding cassette, subfamily B, multidrug efflux pump
MNHIRPLLRFVKPYWKKSLVSLVLLLIVVVLDLAIPRLVQRIIDDGILQQDMSVVWGTFIVMLVISILNTIFAIGNNNFSVQVGEAVSRDLREVLFLKIQSFSHGNLDKLKTGQLIVRLTSDISVFQRLVQISLRIGTRAPFLMVGSLILMFITNARLALTIMPLLVITGGILVFFVIKLSPLFMAMQKRLDRLNTVLQENISGVRVVKAFVRDDYEESRFHEANLEFTQYNIKVMQFLATLMPVLILCLNIGIVIIVWSGGLQAIQGNLTAGQIAAFINYLQTTLIPLMIMAGVANIWAAAAASSQRINEVLDTKTEVTDQEDAVLPPPGLKPRVVFENVSFHYNGVLDEKVLEDVNLEVEPGETVAILGATGSGKTTLVNLIPRFYDVSKGRVTMDGMDIRRMKQDALLSKIGIVPQETVLFSGTVRDNIRFGKPEAEDDEVEAAARAAQAHEFIMALPEGYDTHVEQRGVNLSGGQKQRIAIARALLTRPDILILDDSTSAVDVETETKIQDALEDWGREQTRFVVAQRISTVLKADKIVVLEKGRVAAVGNHRELLASSPIYKEIYASQLGNGFEAGS